MEDKLLPLNRGGARGGGTSTDSVRDSNKRAAKLIEEGLNSSDPLDNIPLQFEPIRVHRTASHACACGCTEFTVLAYKCCKCGKKSV